MSTKITDLRPAAQQMASEGFRLLKLAGIPVCVTSTLRTEQEQWALYCQGRKPLAFVNAARRDAGMWSISEKENKYTVTNCDGIKTKSRHQGGTAIDIVPANDKGNPIWPPISDPRWKQIADIMQSVGFFWGGTWTNEKDGIEPDMPHFELHEIKGV